MTIGARTMTGLLLLAALAPTKGALAGEARVLATIEVQRPVGRMIGESRAENGVTYFVVAGDGLTCAGGFDPAGEAAVSDYRFACSDGTTGHAEIEWRPDGSLGTGGFVVDGKGEIGTVTVKAVAPPPAPEDVPPAEPERRKT